MKCVVGAQTRMQAHAAHKVLGARGAGSGVVMGPYALHMNSNCAMFTSNLPVLRMPPQQAAKHPQYRCRRLPSPPAMPRTEPVEAAAAVRTPCNDLG